MRLYMNSIPLSDWLEIYQTLVKVLYVFFFINDFLYTYYFYSKKIYICNYSLLSLVYYTGLSLVAVLVILSPVFISLSLTVYSWILPLYLSTLLASLIWCLQERPVLTISQCIFLDKAYIPILTNGKVPDTSLACLRLWANVCGMQTMVWIRYLRIKDVIRILVGQVLVTDMWAGLTTRWDLHISITYK